MISFRNLLNGPINFNKPLAIGAYDLGGDLIAVCRDYTDSEIKQIKYSDFVKETGLKPKRKSENPCLWDCWEVVIEIPDDPNQSKDTAIRKMIASIWAIGSGLQNLLESKEPEE
jgi:hypothetical protein